MTMDAPFYRCEDCGAVFTKTELLPDVEEDLLSCPECGGLDIELVEKDEAAA
jgi:DNA-directed RNA polymerase subunit RPC12/RpoP